MRWGIWELDVHVEAGDRRAAAYARAYVEIAGVLIIAYTFLTTIWHDPNIPQESKADDLGGTD